MKIKIHTIEDEKVNCPECGSHIKQIGKEVVRQEVEYIPAKLVLKNYVRYIYKCEKCGTEGTEKNNNNKDKSTKFSTFTFICITITCNGSNISKILYGSTIIYTRKNDASSRKIL